MVTGLVPHVGGPISMGFPTVLIGFMPAARVGDMAICVGPPDVIAMGSMTVMIGNMQAARMGDLTAHGGTIAMGCPTVIIGDVGMGGAGTAQGNAMAGAKRKAKPFCEECEKARKELERLEKEEDMEPHPEDEEDNE
jgi:uncharacterized Zn-binding protein involved in type VI secretion